MQITLFFKPVLSTTLIFACLFTFQCKRLHATDMLNTKWSLAALKNTTYSGLKAAPAPVKLVDGRWEGAPYVDGGASRPSVHFVGDHYPIGKVAGNAADAAVVFLAESSGGSGRLVYLAVVEKRNGVLTNTATAALGDRVQVRDVRIENGAIAVDVLQAGPQDAACCPGELATRHWRLNATGIVASETADRTGRLSLDVLADTAWRLRAWDVDEPAPDAPEITLSYDNSRLAGSAGCNRYFAMVEAGDRPGDLQVGPSGSTRMICPEAIMAIEQRFLHQLSGATTFAFMAGQLAISFERDGRRGTMHFNRKEGRP
ncbi:META domain-containing protein [Desulfosarcina sp.]|uniref:META domain-containing protein n=1 Tax=Desulfosarcina sp. TaxID=2027861 RepID=UPI0035620DEE